VSIQNILGGKVYSMGLRVNIRYFGGVKCHYLNIGSKSANEWIVQGVKCIFSKYLWGSFTLDLLNYHAI
jgi:hypothetical protein